MNNMVPSMQDHEMLYENTCLKSMEISGRNGINMAAFN
jgi:hypothetical protein